MTDTKKYDLETVEALAQVICGMCSEERPRWKDEQYGDFCHHANPHDQEGAECEADAVLQAALKLGVPVETKPK